MIQLEKQDGVGIMTMGYQSENRFNPDFLRAMMDGLDEAEKDPEIRAIVVTGGDPKFFSNGLDLDWLTANGDDMDKVLGYLKLVNDMFKRWTLYPKPTVAALNGHTFAAGLFMAAHIDFRFMREDRGWICMPEVDYTGARLTGPEAVEIGFVERVYPVEALLPACIEFASMLGKKKTATYAKMKQCVREEIARILDEVDPNHFAETISFSSSP